MKKGNEDGRLTTIKKKQMKNYNTSDGWKNENKLNQRRNHMQNRCKTPLQSFQIFALLLCNWINIIYVSSLWINRTNRTFNGNIWKINNTKERAKLEPKIRCYNKIRRLLGIVFYEHPFLRLLINLIAEITNLFRNPKLCFLPTFMSSSQRWYYCVLL